MEIPEGAWGSGLDFSRGELRGALLAQLEWHWSNQLRPRLDGLTDDEYLWEPVPGCWSVRPRDEATAPTTAVPGEDPAPGASGSEGS